MNHTDVTSSKQPPPTSRPLLTAARRLSHPLVHIAGLLVAHIVAVAVLEKTPLLALLSLH